MMQEIIYRQDGVGKKILEGFHMVFASVFAAFCWYIFVVVVAAVDFVHTYRH